MTTRTSLLEIIEFPTLLLSVVFVGMGLLFTYLLGRQTTLECAWRDARQDCILRTTWLGWVNLNQRGIQEVRSATVEENCDDEGCTYRVSIRTNDDVLPLGSAYSSGYTGKQNAADQINRFAAGELPTLNVSNSAGLWIFFPLIFVAVGIGLVYKPILHLLRALLNPEG